MHNHEKAAGIVRTVQRIGRGAKKAVGAGRAAIHDPKRLAAGGVLNDVLAGQTTGSMASLFVPGSLTPIAKLPLVDSISTAGTMGALMAGGMAAGAAAPGVAAGASSVAKSVGKTRQAMKRLQHMKARAAAPKVNVKKVMDPQALSVQKISHIIKTASRISR
jgi:hypothetical protein